MRVRGSGIGRRALGGMLLAAPAAAQAFRPQAEAAGRRLRLNGTGTRRYLGFAVYEAALYLEEPSADAAAIIASPGAKLILVRYVRSVAQDAVAAAWAESYRATCGCPVPEPLRRYLHALTAGDTERYLFLPEAAEVSASSGEAARLEGAEASRTLLATWIGAAPPSAALRHGLLGGRPGAAPLRP